MAGYNSYLKSILTVISLFLVLSVPILAHDFEGDDLKIHYGFDGLTIKNINIDYNEDQDLTVKNLDENNSFTITSGYQLFVNDQLIETNPEQQKLVEQLYLSMEDIKDEAKEIGWSGVAIGAEGAKLGLRAVLKFFKLLSPNYDMDDLEEEIDQEAKRIERKADLIEDRADGLEDMARDLEKLCKKMKKEIPALQQLSWF